jgi:hypothetical protein
MLQRPAEPATRYGIVPKLLRSLRNSSASESAAFSAPSEFVKPRPQLSVGILSKRTDMKRHPTTSGSSHHLKGVFLGV